MTGKETRPQAIDLDTAERMASTGRSVIDALAHEARGEHETQDGTRHITRADEVERIVEGWPDAQKDVARQMLDKYGHPNEATPTKLFWYRNGPWKRTELARDSVVHNWPAPHSDFLSQTIDYRVPLGMFDEIARFDGSILVDRTRGEVSARCDLEAANVTSLNMVHEIVTGKRTVEEARQTLEQNKIAYAIGRSAPYAEHLLFAVPQGGTEDVDEVAIGGAILEQTAGKVKDVLSGDRAEATDRLTGREPEQA